MIWNDRKIHEWASTGGVTPFCESLINPASLDLRLGDQIRIPRQAWSLLHGDIVGKKTPASELWQEPESFYTFTLWPGQMVLCHSLEYVHVPVSAAAMLLSKSSTGRIGLEHLHSGWTDSGFMGQMVFEFKNLAPWPIELVAGECYVQLVFMDMAELPTKDYSQTGRYQGQTGATPHRVQP